MIVPDGYLPTRQLFYFAVRALSEKFIAFREEAYPDDNSELAIGPVISMAAVQLLEKLHHQSFTPEGSARFRCFHVFTPALGPTRLDAPRFWNRTQRRAAVGDLWAQYEDLEVEGQKFQRPRHKHWSVSLIGDWWCQNVYKAAHDLEDARLALSDTYSEISPYAFSKAVFAFQFTPDVIDVNLGDIFLASLGQRATPFNLETGIVSCERLQLELQAMEAGEAFSQVALKAGISVPKVISRKAEPSSGAAKGIADTLRVLNDYSGFPIIVTEVDYEAFAKVVRDSILVSGADVQLGDVSVVDQILHLANDNPQLTKAEIRNIIGAKISVRRFNMYWENASQRKPELSQPGRKPKKS